ncbi:extracellular solute-binding protein [Methyloligella sp. 2.7D]|uniref:ABC transporter substrate-binding protein n=1 Tax=unclassified Methyloligella TaxID=2625955 RepID=UPI00157D9BA4|nr:extracellular solute-binding protein [Methyloligella sp. GL2]QKP77921.1 ABC transporter substrate-binding protein [Methyloligella sp. GL2]
MSKDTTQPDGIVRVRQYVDLDRRQLLKTAAAAGAVAAIGLPGLPRKAHAADSLNYVGWEGYDTFLTEGDIAESTGKTLQNTYISSADEVVTKLRLGADQVDICTPYFIHDNFLAAEGLLEPLDIAKIPNFSKINSTVSEYCKENMQLEGKWYAAPMTYGSICMLYNADKAEKPTSWTDMLKDEYKGKCAITADYTGNLFAWGRVAGVKNPHRMTHKELAKTVELLIDLKKNHLRTIAPSYGDLVNMLSSGEVVMCQGWEPVTTWVGDGANIQIAYPKEKSMGFIEGYAIGKGSGDVDAAHAYINNALSLKGQLAGATANSMPVVTDEAMEKADDANKAMYDYADLSEYFEVKTMVVPMYPVEEDGDLAVWDDYQEAWEKVLKS